MKYISHIGFAVFLAGVSVHLEAQNLVPNYSFEDYTPCPNSYGQIYFATPWFQPNIFNNNSWQLSSNSDLYNSCSIGPFTSVPYNTIGFQNARTGNGYAGIFVFGVDLDWREYIEIGLDSPLIQGRRYCVEFFVSRGEGYTVAIDRIGAYFSTDSVLYDGTLLFNSLIENPQVENPAGNIITDTVNWVSVRGSFVAEGGEKFMLIGNFRDSIGTSWTLLGSQSLAAAYYYIDDISVYELPTDSTSCFDGVGINETIGNGQILIYPNPAANVLYVTGYMLYEKSSVEIYDVLGQKCLTPALFEGEGAGIDVASLENGIYFLQLRNDSQTRTEKFIISR